MSVPVEFWRDLASYLKLTARVVEKVGQDINVGEKFTLEFTLRNEAPYSGTNVPLIRFKKPQLSVLATSYARPDAGLSVNIDLPVAVLAPQQSTAVKVMMKATADISGWWDDLWNQEKIATARVQTTLDAEAFFAVKRSYAFEQEIEPT